MGTVNIYNARMLELIAWAKDRGIVATKKESLEFIGFMPENIPKIKSGTRFTADQMIKASQLTGVWMDWICRLENRRLIKRRILKQTTVI